jgi:homoaconitase/3-isopropylmalate dehydratase large subunit
MSLASRMTMSNMAVEIGAKFGFFVPDRKVPIFKRTSAEALLPIVPDPDARYEAVYEVDVSSLEPQIAFPFSVDNVHAVSGAKDIKIHQAFIGSCTNGRLEDLHTAAGILRGKKVHPEVRLLVIPASWEIYRQAMKDGTLDTLIEAGAVIGNSSCGPCFGAHMGLLGSDENCIAAINRNFKGRMEARTQRYSWPPGDRGGIGAGRKITDQELSLSQEG